MPERASDKRNLSPKVKAMSHRLRLEITDLLFSRDATAAEIAEALDQPVGRVRYMLRVLVEEGLIDTVEMRERRGALERVYSGSDFILSSAEAAALPMEVKEKINTAVIRNSMEDAVGAQRAGTLTNRDDSAFVRFPLLVDEPGWEELAKLHQEMLDRVIQIRDECRARLKVDEGADVTPAISINLLFETPDP